MSNTFAVQLNSLSEAPEPFRNALQLPLSQTGPAELLLYSPPSQSGKTTTPGSLLVITPKNWLVAIADQENKNSALLYQSDFSHIILVEFTTILLQGRLKIDFAAEGGVKSVQLHFNTVSEPLYRQAEQLMLDRMDEITAPPSVPTTPPMNLLNRLPFKFQNAVLHATPEGERLLQVAHCDVILSRNRLRFQRELAPESAISLTDRELMFVTEEKASSPVPSKLVSKYGNIVTHCPLSRFSGFRIEDHKDKVTLILETHATQGGELFQIDIPVEKKHEITEMLQKAPIGSRGMSKL